MKAVIIISGKKNRIIDVEHKGFTVQNIKPLMELESKIGDCQFKSVCIMTMFRYRHAARGATQTFYLQELFKNLLLSSLRHRSSCAGSGAHVSPRPLHSSVFETTPPCVFDLSVNLLNSDDQRSHTALSTCSPSRL